MDDLFFKDSVLDTVRRKEKEGFSVWFSPELGTRAMLGWSEMGSREFRSDLHQRRHGAHTLRTHGLPAGVHQEKPGYRQTLGAQINSLYLG